MYARVDVFAHIGEQRNSHLSVGCLTTEIQTFQVQERRFVPTHKREEDFKVTSVKYTCVISIEMVSFSFFYKPFITFLIICILAEKQKKG